jgi:hypothetical protein
MTSAKAIEVYCFTNKGKPLFVYIHEADVCIFRGGQICLRHNQTLMKKTILALSIGTLLFASCKKEDTSFVATKENLAGSYKLTAVTYAGINVFNNSNESLNIFEACERDDIFTLNINSTYAVADAGTECDPASDAEGTWEFINSKTISVNGETSTIMSWDGKVLVTEANTNGAAVVTTMAKQ